MRSKLFVVVPALALALSGCKKESVEGPLAGCMPAGVSTSVCIADSECCSFACEYGVCMPNPVEGGVCRSNGDCQAPRLCLGGRCTTATCNAGGGCVPGVGQPCCIGSCTFNVCQTDRPPVAVASRTPSTAQVPWHVPVQLSSLGSYDPDGGGLTYSWDVVSAPTAVTFTPSASYPNPTVTPNAIGTYNLLLTVRSNNLFGTAPVQFQAINTPPAIDMPPDIITSVHWSRNVPLTFAAGVADADGGPVNCKWEKTSPGNVTSTVVADTWCAGASGTAASSTFGLTFSEDEAGLWKLTLTATDGVNTTTADRFVDVVNDDPEILPTTGPMAVRYGNKDNDPVPLTGYAIDKNGDTITWEWRVTATKPVDSAWVDADLVGTAQTVHFDADAVGTFVLNLHVEDGHGGFADKPVTVYAYPHVLPLGTIEDATYVVGSDLIVAVGTDGGGSHRLWILDPFAQNFDPGGAVTLLSAPTAVAVNGSQAIVAEQGGRWEVVALASRATSGVQRTGLGFDAGDVVYANGFVFASPKLGGQLVELLPGAAAPGPYSRPAQQPASDPLPLGNRVVSGTIVSGTPVTYVWLQDPARSLLRRYEVKNNAQLMNPVSQSASLSGSGGLWLSADLASLFTSPGTAYASAGVSPLSQVGSLPAAAGPNGHVYSSDVLGTQHGIVANPATSVLVRFSGASFTETLPALALPPLGVNGNAIPHNGHFAFIRSDGTEAYSIVTADPGGGLRWGLVKIPTP